MSLAADLVFVGAADHDEDTNFIVEAIMNEDLSREDIHSIVDRAVADLLNQATIEKPPVDVVQMAQILGIAVEPHQKAAQSGLKKDFLTRPDATPEAKQWLAAQAIGDHFKRNTVTASRLVAGRKAATLG